VSVVAPDASRRHRGGEPHLKSPVIRFLDEAKRVMTLPVRARAQHLANARVQRFVPGAPR